MKSIASPSSRLELLEQPQHLGLHHHVERGRRLVGDQQLRVAGERERDQHALALAARELVRVVARAARRDADQLEQLADARRVAVTPAAVGGAARSPRAIWQPTRCTGLSVCSAPWKTIAMPGPAHRAQPARRIVEHVLALEQHLAAHLRARRQQPQERRRRASTCRSPTRPASPSVSPAARSKSTPRTAGTARAGAVGHVQVTDREQGGARLAGSRSSCRRSRGSRISSRAWPISVKASTTSTMPSPGGR